MSIPTTTARPISALPARTGVPTIPVHGSARSGILFAAIHFPHHRLSTRSPPRASTVASPSPILIPLPSPFYPAHHGRASCQPGCSSQRSVSHSTIYPRYLSQFNSIAHSPAISFARFPYVWALSIPSCVALPPASGFVAPFLASLLVEIDVGDGCSYSASVCDCACYLNVLRHARGYAGSLCPLCQMCDSFDVSCHFLVAVLPFVARSCLVSAPVFVVVLASTLMTVIGVGKHGALTPQFCQTTRMRVMHQ